MVACSGGPSYQGEQQNNLNNINNINTRPWQQEIIYQLITDRFSDGDKSNNQNVDIQNPRAYHGGDWQGIIDKLPYLQKLGVTAIWISPVVKNIEGDAGFSAYHGYWPQDFYATNPHFGDLKTLKKLVDDAHSRGIRVIMDLVVNHIAQLYFYDLNHNGVPDGDVNGRSEYDPPYDPKGIKDIHGKPAPIVWFNIKKLNRVPAEPKPFQSPDFYHKIGRTKNWDTANQYRDTDKRNEVIFGDFPGGLKDLATERKDVQSELIKMANYWIKETGIDGFRLDAVKHVAHTFWQRFIPEVRRYAAKQGKPRFIFFGEIFGSPDQLTGSYTFNNELDSVLYFPLEYTLRRVIKGGEPTTLFQKLNSDRLKHYCNQNTQKKCSATLKHHQVAPNELLINFIDNHDVNRFLAPANDEPYLGLKQLKLALLYIFTAPGIPSLYYGTEHEFKGGHEPANRENLAISGYKTDTPLFQFIQQLINLREKYPALQFGDYQLLTVEAAKSDAQDGGVLVFKRIYQHKTMIIALNINPKFPRTIILPKGKFKAIFPNNHPIISKEITLKPGTALILEN